MSFRTEEDAAWIRSDGSRNGQAGVLPCERAFELVLMHHACPRACDDRTYKPVPLQFVDEETQQAWYRVLSLGQVMDIMADYDDTLVQLVCGNTSIGTWRIPRCG